MLLMRMGVLPFCLVRHAEIGLALIVVRVPAVREGVGSRYSRKLSDARGLSQLERLRNSAGSWLRESGFGGAAILQRR
jgi:hypothetical protein